MCDIFEMTDLPTLIAECVPPKCISERTVHQTELKTFREVAVKSTANGRHTAVRALLSASKAKALSCASLCTKQVSRSQVTASGKKF